MKGILFKAEMVRAILEGRKTVTRRVVKPAIGPLLEKSCLVNGYPAIHLLDFDIKTPYEPGEVVYVKERWAAGAWRVGEVDVYYSDEKKPITKKTGAQFITSLDADESLWRPCKSTKHDPFRIRSSLHMPEWASRIHLEIVSVRPERVQEITEEEAMREGVNWQDNAGLARFTARKMFITLWESIHPGSWDQNPWVWRVEFKVAKETP